MKAVIVCTAILGIVQCQNFAFPEPDGQETTSNRLSIGEKRIPLYAPDRCADNQLLYPGDQETDWVCDCGPGFIYYPPRDACFAAYRRGPCNPREYLILRSPDVIPQCASNPCRTDGYVRYGGRCYQLDQPGGPCRPVLEGGGVFGVNITTLALECLKGPNSLHLIKVPPNCPPGSRRDCHQEYRKK